MLELQYDVFMKHYEEQQKSRNEDYRKLHYLEDNTKFTLYLKGADYWEYYTILHKSTIYEFGVKYGASEEQSIKDYKMNVLFEAVPISKKEDLVMDLPRDIIEHNTEQLTKSPNEPFEKEDAKDYADFLKKKFYGWERKIFSFLDETIGAEVNKQYITDKGYNVLVQKTMGDFLHRLFNVVNTADFLSELKRVIRINIKEGVAEAEQEINLDIGIGVEFRGDASKAASRQLEGFYIEGKRWHGLKGVAKDLQNEIDNIIRLGITDRKSMQWIKDEIQLSFKKYTGDKVTEGRATKIARTESSRFRGEAKLKAIKSTGLEVIKVWNSFIDDRTTKICRNLNGQKRQMNEMFVDPDTGLEYEHNPAHVNCRSKINYELVE